MKVRSRLSNSAMEAVRLPAKEDVDEFCEELAEELTEELTERERRQHVALGHVW